MPNKNVYLPRELSDKVKELDINVSKVLQEALEDIIEEQTKRCLRCGRSLSDE